MEITFKELFDFITNVAVKRNIEVSLTPIIGPYSFNGCHVSSVSVHTLMKKVRLSCLAVRLS